MQTDQPFKTELGIISKKILEKYITVLRDKTGYNHWKNTDTVIDWFQNLNDKNNTFHYEGYSLYPLETTIKNND